MTTAVCPLESFTTRVISRTGSSRYSTAPMINAAITDSAATSVAVAMPRKMPPQITIGIKSAQNART